MVIEELDGLGERDRQLIDRRSLVVASAGALVLGFVGPLAAAAQSATPEGEAEADPTPRRSGPDCG